MFSRFWALLVGALLLLSTPALATVTITRDDGGLIDRYINLYTTLNNRGDNIVVAGDCASACTLFTGIVPNDRVCVTPKARLGFHSGSWATVSDDGEVIPLGYSRKATRELWAVYPAKLKALLSSKGWRGGKHPNLLWLDAKELRAYGFKACEG